MISKLTAASALASVGAKEGISFVVVGDFANINHMTPPNAVFNDINAMKQSAQRDSPEDFDFFLTVGDNLYPRNGNYPTNAEFNEMLDLFRKRSAIKNLPIYPVRGNHDCYFYDMDAEIKLRSWWSNWDMPANYYHKTFDLNSQGDKFSLLAIDSCFYLCETVARDKEKYLPLLSETSKKLYYEKCEEGHTYVDWGNKQMAWIAKTIDEVKSDPSIKWKAITAHHPMFGIHEGDKMQMVDHLLPMMRQHEYDFYFTGHEHIMTYSQAPKQGKGEPKRLAESWFNDLAAFIPNADCRTHYEWFPEGGSRERTYQQHERVHQFTLGASGRDDIDPICFSHYSRGEFLYAEDKYYGFALVHMTASQTTVTLKGSMPVRGGWTDDLKHYFGFEQEYTGLQDLLKITINGSRSETEAGSNDDEIL